MKQDWEIKSISDVCLSLDDGDWIEKKNQSTKGIRLIQTGNIGCGEYRDKSEKAKYISEETFRTLKCTEVVAGDILVSRLPDPVGRACIVPYLSTKCITAVDCSIVKLNPKIISAKWFIYYTLSAEYKTKVIAECSGTTRDRISRKKLSVISLPIPPLAEQERIVEILDREFERIDALKVNAEHNLQHAKDLFQSALKQELQPKEGWDISTLGDVCDIQGGSTPKRTEKAFWDNGTYPWFTVEDIREQGRIITNTKQKITKLAWDKLRVFPKNTVLLCCTASLGEYALTKIPLTSNQQFNGLSIKDENLLNPMYLLHYCSTLKDKLFTLSGKTTIDFVATGKVKQIEISFPSLVEQGKVVARLDKLKEHCTALEENYTKTIALCDDMKQALLRKAFNGEL